MSSYADWNALGKIALVAFAGGAGIVAVYALAILSAARAEEARERGQTAVLPLALAGVALLVCLAAVALGVWAMTQKG
jgi:nitrate reductase gamma subunit